MKQNHGIIFVLQLLLIVLLLVSHYSSAARLLKPIIINSSSAAGEGETMEENAIIAQAEASISDEATNDLSNLMGSNNIEEDEECGEKNRNEECVKRRMIAEAHLDYIYTQHHKPKP